MLNRKGVAFLVVMIFLILTSITVIVFMNMLHSFLLLSRRQEPDMQNFYCAEFGLKRAKWLIDEAASIPSSDTLYVDLDRDGTSDVTVSITISSISSTEYDIVSQAGTRRLEAKYVGGMLIFQ